VGVATSWYTASGTPSATTTTTWSLCSTGICNSPGNLVKVVVTYPMAFHIPFYKSVSLNLNSTSQMVISQ
jgi:hypothetical protein